MVEDKFMAMVKIVAQWRFLRGGVRGEVLSWLIIFISPQKFMLAPSCRGESAPSLVFRVVLVTLVFCCSWTTYLEQLTCQSARQGSQLHRIQKTTENIYVSNGLRRIVTFMIIAPYKYSYLLTYCRETLSANHRAV